MRRQKIHHRAVVIIVAVLFAIVGTYFTWRSLAVAPAASIEVENGSLTPPAVTINDSAASAGKGVRFGSTTPTPTGCKGAPAVIWCDDFDTFSLSSTSGHRNWLPSEQGVNDNGHLGGGSYSWEWTPKGTPSLSLWTVANGALTMKAVRNPGNLTHGGTPIPNKAVIGACRDKGERPISWIGGTMTTDPATGGAWTYGYFEFRARVPVHGKGMFPALWMYRSVDVSHHADAEFDLMEIFGKNGQPWSTTVHYSGQRDSTDGDRGYGSDTAGWHRYGVDWQADHIAFFRDGVEYARRTGGEAQWFNGARMGIRMDYAANPCWDDGAQSDGSTPNPLYMEVDYVRAYKNKPANFPTGTNDPHGG